jgi:hypothetical protein
MVQLGGLGGCLRTAASRCTLFFLVAALLGALGGCGVLALMPVHHIAIVINEILGFQCIQDRFHRLQVNALDHGYFLRINFDNATRIMLRGGIEDANPHRDHKGHRLLAAPRYHLQFRIMRHIVICSVPFHRHPAPLIIK